MVYNNEMITYRFSPEMPFNVQCSFSICTVSVAVSAIISYHRYVNERYFFVILSILCLVAF